MTKHEGLCEINAPLHIVLISFATSNENGEKANTFSRVASIFPMVIRPDERYSCIFGNAQLTTATLNLRI